jgi:Domain of unknown function (DUF4376)
MITTLDHNGYPISEVDELLAAHAGISIQRSTSIPRTGDRFVDGAWVSEPDQRGTWHDPATMDVVHLAERGAEPPPGWVHGEPPQKKPKPLAELRAEAWSRIKRARDAAEFGPFVWGGHTFDGDAVSLSRLGQALEAARFAIATNDAAFTQPWKLANNAWITLTATQVFEVYRARAQNTLDAHLHAEALRMQVDAATSAEQLDAITWE